MENRDSLGNSQFLTYDGKVDAEIGRRTREKLEQLTPKLNQKQFADKLEMTTDALSRSLSGKRAFTAVELVRIADVLGTSAHWLITGEPDPFAVKVAGRQTFDHAAKLHNPLDWSAVDDVISSLALAYLQVYPAPTANVVSHVPGSARAARDALQRAFDGDFIRHLSEATEAAFGVDIVRVGEFRDGIAMEVVGRSAIVVGETGNWFFENWSIAHELGHIAHDDLSEFGTAACDDPVAERAANAFAAELLLPEESLRSKPWNVMEISGLARLIWTCGVSTQALQNRLSALGIAPSPAVSSGLAMNTQALLRRSGIFREESADLITERMQNASSRRFPEHLLSAHGDAVSEGKIGASVLAWMLGVSAAELDEQLAPPIETHVDVEQLARELGLVDPST
jgi:Zn-dependent peptidase ImmA (M78 family)/transcriptional regulator with XRE-family HTH domain